MAFQPTNYASLPIMGLEYLQQGMDVGLAPFKEYRNVQEAKREAEAAKLANELIAMQLQYMPKEMEAAIAYKQAQTQAAQQEAQKQRMFIEYLSGGMGGGSSAGMPGASPMMGQQMPLGADGMTPQGQMGIGEGQGAPRSMPMQAQIPALPSQQEMYFRRALGLSELTPQEQLAMDLYKSQAGAMASKNIEQAFTEQYGTTTHQTDKQTMAMGIENALPVLDELIEFDTPGQQVGKYFSWNDQPAYKAMVANVTDKLVAGLGLPKSNESLHTVREMVERAPLESLSAYRKRLRNLSEELSNTYQRAAGKPYQGNSHGKGLKLNDPKVLHTAKKYNMTPEQVIQQLEAKNGR